MTPVCTKCTQALRFPNQGRTLPWERHAAKFGGAQVARFTRCPADASVKFTALSPAELPLEVAPKRQPGSRAAQSENASTEPGGRRRPSPQARSTRYPAAAHPGGPCPSGPRSPLRSVLIASQQAPARLDTPLPSGRVEEAKNGVISRASVLCQPLEKGPVGGPRDAAEEPRRGSLRSGRSDLREGASGRVGAGAAMRGAPVGAKGAQRGARGRERACLDSGFVGDERRGSHLPGRQESDARHSLCSIKRGEATHHGAQPLSEEKVA